MLRSAAWICCALLAADGADTICGPIVGGTQDPTSIFSPNSPPAHELRDMAWLVIGICAAIGLVVEGVLLWSIFRFRSRSSGAEPTQVYGSGPVELAWTVIPCIIVFVLTLATVRTIREVELTERPEGSLLVKATGHQWWWEYRYPELGIVTANELVVPVGKTVWLELESADVIHSWWVPRLAGKTDLVPGWPNATWFRAEEGGVYLGQCAEYCGAQHANMLLRVEARPEAEFDQWAKGQAAPPSAVGLGSDGHRLFTSLSCANCHTIAGQTDGTFGPDLSHLMSRATIGAGVAPLTPESLRTWIADPQNLKVECNMPSLTLDPAQVASIASYLETLR